MNKATPSEITEAEDSARDLARKFAKMLCTKRTPGDHNKRAVTNAARAAFMDELEFVLYDLASGYGGATASYRMNPVILWTGFDTHESPYETFEADAESGDEGYTVRNDGIVREFLRTLMPSMLLSEVTSAIYAHGFRRRSLDGDRDEYEGVALTMKLYCQLGQDGGIAVRAVCTQHAPAMRLLPYSTLYEVAICEADEDERDSEVSMVTLPVCEAEVRPQTKWIQVRKPLN